MGRFVIKGVRHTTTISHPDLVVTRYPMVCRQREVMILSGMSTSRSLAINDPDIGTLECAILERMFYVFDGGVCLQTPTPNQEVVNSRMFNFGRKVFSHVKTATPVSPEEVPLMYKGRKQTIYLNALERYNWTGIERSHALSKVFVKCEKVNPSKAPRCINPRDPVYNLILGRYIKPIESRVYRGIAKAFGRGPIVMKGYDVNQIGAITASKWNAFKNPVAIGLDAKRFDAHVSAQMLKWEHSIYLQIYKYTPELQKLLNWQVHNQGVGYCADGKLKFQILGKRFSGDMNTALGNCLIMCGMIYSYLESKGITDADLLNNGDDCVVLVEAEQLGLFLEGLDEWFYDLGFRMTTERPVYQLEEIEFCQMHPIKVNNGWRMVRNIAAAREKDSMCVHNFKAEKAFKKWMYAVGECGLAVCSGVPIMQSMYLSYVRMGLPSNMCNDLTFQTGMSYMRGKLESKPQPITDDARLGVFVAWGITPDEQMQIEKQYEELQIDFSPQEVSYPSDIPASNL